VPVWLAEMLTPIKTSCSGIIPTIGRIIGECKSFAEYNFSTDPTTGFPDPAACETIDFSQFGRTPDVASAWQSFFTNTTIKQHFMNFWKTVATAMSGADGVIGYDLVNEPLSGNFFDNADLLLPGHGDSVMLQPLYKDLYTIIQAADPGGIVMYEPNPFPDTYPSNIPLASGVHSMGFTQGPATSNGGNASTQALSYHIYSCGFAENNCDPATGDPPCKGSTCDNYARDAMEMRSSEANNLGGGVFLSEFGACSDTALCHSEIDRMTVQADTKLQSWAYWQFKYNDDVTTVSGPLESFYYPNGTLQRNKVDVLSRTFAPAISGDPTLMRFDRNSGAFRLHFTSVEGRPNGTTVFFNEEAHYGTGHLMHVLNGSASTLGANFIEVNASSSASVDVDFVLVRPDDAPASGAYTDGDNDYITWTRTNGTSGFSLSQTTNLTWWKGLYVYGQSGQQLCALEVQDGGHGPKRCDLGETHDLIIDYRIELWKAKTFGVHTKIDEIDSAHFGPLLLQNIDFTWMSD